MLRIISRGCVRVGGTFAELCIEPRHECFPNSGSGGRASFSRGYYAIGFSRILRAEIRGVVAHLQIGCIFGSRRFESELSRSGKLDGERLIHLGCRERSGSRRGRSGMGLCRPRRRARDSAHGFRMIACRRRAQSREDSKQDQRGSDVSLFSAHIGRSAETRGALSPQDAYSLWPDPQRFLARPGMEREGCCGASRLLQLSARPAGGMKSECLRLRCSERRSRHYAHQGSPAPQKARFRGRRI